MSESKSSKSVSFSFDDKRPAGGTAPSSAATTGGADGDEPLLNPPAATAAVLGTSPDTIEKKSPPALLSSPNTSAEAVAALPPPAAAALPSTSLEVQMALKSVATDSSAAAAPLPSALKGGGGGGGGLVSAATASKKVEGGDDNADVPLAHMSAPSPNIHLRRDATPAAGAAGSGAGGGRRREPVTTGTVKEKLLGFQKRILSLLVDFVMWALVNIFFREVSVVGLENIPKEGPIVFYGNHQNQFIDAMMIRAHCGRPVRYIIAEKSMSRPIIGHFAKIMEAVPVVRPQDVGSTAGAGKIVKTECNIITGEGTDFKSILHVGDVISWSVPTKKERCSGQVIDIISDTSVKLSMAVEPSDMVTTPTSFKFSRRIDHSEMYAEVYGTLERGGCIGIFPEGGSHDRTSLQPMKAGVALFTLGAAERGTPVKMIPCGLTYFFGHKFRSRAHLEFGEPIEPPKALIEAFKTNKRAATGELLKVLDLALRGVTINVPDWQTLKFLHSFRRLYQPQNCLLQTRDYLRLTRRLSLLIASHGDEPDFSDFRTKVENYSDYCAALLVRDSQAATLENIEHANLTLLTRRMFMLVCMGIILIPFGIISLPVGITTHFAAEAHARTALAASTIKVVGADVKGSYKIVIGFVVVPLVMTMMAATVGYFTDARTGLTVFFCTPMAMYVSLMILQEFVMELRASLPLVMSLFSKHKQFKKLFERRKKLVGMAQEIVAKYDPELVKEIAIYESASAGSGTDLRMPSLFSLRGGSRRRDAKGKKL